MTVAISNKNRKRAIIVAAHHLIEGSPTKYVIVLFALMPALAWGQNTPKSQSGIQPRPHSCGMNYYPPEQIKEHIEGTTTLSFHITVTGDVDDVSVANSSGNLELDKAAISCVKYWKYHPATQYRKPIEVSWKAVVVWQIPVAPPLLEIVRDCPSGDPPSIRYEAASRAVTLSFNVEPDGTVRNVTINKPSGDDELDKVAAACLKARIFKPPMLNGIPTEISASTSLTWRPASERVSNSVPLVAPAGETVNVPGETGSY